MEYINAIGRRKSAVARVYVSEGTGKITINKKDLTEYFPSAILQYVVKQPLNLWSAKSRVVPRHAHASSSASVNLRPYPMFSIQTGETHRMAA